VVERRPDAAPVETVGEFEVVEDAHVGQIDRPGQNATGCSRGAQPIPRPSSDELA
jgi:hypothetical protein